MRTAILSHAYLDPAARGKLRALAGLGCAVAVAVPERWPGPDGRGELVARFQDDAGVRIVPIRVGGGDDPAWHRGDLERLLADFRPDVVQVEEEPESRAAARALKLAERLRLPRVLHSWRALPPRLGFRAERRRRRTLERASALIAGNRLAATILGQARPGVPLTTLPQLGVTPPLRVERMPQEEFTIGFVGRLVPEKGLETLLHACVKMHGRWRLTVAGTGPEQVRLEELAEKLGLGSRITWLGMVPQEELVELWPQVDCVVQPSIPNGRWVETHSYAMVEAMAWGVSAVVADCGALPELVGGAGLVVPPGDVAALTGALQRLRDDLPAREAQGAEGRKRVMEEFTDSAVAQRTLAFWQELRG
ncbi:MAG TPA: glycosyltransferase family 4 protein, partial [Gemmatimonadales bacterium]|nr:glycosyltransferase family 4 protein [Gemmatimonadales bacterium]